MPSYPRPTQRPQNFVAPQTFEVIIVNGQKFRPFLTQMGGGRFRIGFELEVNGEWREVVFREYPQ